MHYDDGLDLIAPPAPEPDMSPTGTPLKIVHDAYGMVWLLPLAMLASAALSALVIFGLRALLK